MRLWKLILKTADKALAPDHNLSFEGAWSEQPPPLYLHQTVPTKEANSHRFSRFQSEPESWKYQYYQAPFLLPQQTLFV